MKINHSILKPFILACMAPWVASAVHADEVDIVGLLTTPNTVSIAENPSQAVMANGDHIDFHVFGDSGPFVFLGPQLYLTSPLPNAQELTRAYIDGLSDRYRVIVADWPRGTGGSSPAIGEINTALNAVDDIERIADAAGAESFAWWGYSFGGAVGLQVAAHSKRVSAVVIAGYPPFWQPMSDMLTAVHQMKAQLIETMGDAAAPHVGASDQSITFYSSIADIDQKALLEKITVPRLVYQDVNDVIEIGGMEHDLSKRTRAAEDELKAMGWEVAWIDSGLDHYAMRDAEANLSVFAPFLDRALLLSTP